MRSRSRTSLLACLAALFVVLTAFVVAGGLVVSVRAQELPSHSVVILPNHHITGTMIDLAAPIALPVTNSERSNSLVLRAVVGSLLLVAGIMGWLLLRRRSAAS